MQKKEKGEKGMGVCSLQRWKNMNVWKMSRILNRFLWRAHYLAERSCFCRRVIFRRGAKMKTRSSDIFLCCHFQVSMVKGLRIRAEPDNSAQRTKLYPRNEIVLF